jgi:hypothetical protein
MADWYHWLDKNLTNKTFATIKVLLRGEGFFYRKRRKRMNGLIITAFMGMKREMRESLWNG